MWLSLQRGGAINSSASCLAAMPSDCDSRRRKLPFRIGQEGEEKWKKAKKKKDGPSWAGDDDLARGWSRLTDLTD